MIRLYIHGSDGLTVLDVGCISGRTSHYHNGKDFLHVVF